VYEIKVTVESLIGTGALNLNTAGFPEIGNSIGDNTLLHTATSSSLIIYSTIYTDEINISNISIKEVKGDHLVGYWKNTGVQKWDDLQPQNLLKYSEDFDNTVWTKFNATVSSNATTSPHSDNSASKLIESTANGEHQVKQSMAVPNGIETATIYAKEAERNWLFVRVNISGTGWTNAYFNLATGSTGTSVGFDSTSITDAGNGWYKCVATFTNRTNGYIQWQISTNGSDTSYTGVSTKGLYIWGAQVNTGEATQTYAHTTSSPRGGNHGTFKNHVFGNIPQTGLMSYNKPMLFDGVDEYVGTTFLDTTSVSSVTLSGWFVHDGIGNNNQIVSWGDNTGFRMRVIDNVVKGLNAGGYSQVAGTTTVTDGGLHLATIVCDSTGFYLYVDGVLEASNSLALSAGSSTNLRIGAYATASELFTGYINEVSIFDTALTADEISELYNNGTALSALEHSKVDNLQGYWRNDGDDVWVDRTPVLGAEQVTNGDFSDGTNDWTGVRDATLSVSDNKLTILDTGTPSANAGAVQNSSIAFVSGKEYQVTATLHSTTSSANYIRISNNSGGSSSISWFPQENVGTSLGVHTFIVTPDTTESGWLSVIGGAPTDSESVWSDVSVKEVKGGNDGTVNGSPETILLTEARNGRDTLGFPINNVNNGYLALHGDGYVEVADDASLDIGTGDFTVEMWVKTDTDPSGKILGKHISDVGWEYYALSGWGGYGYFRIQDDTNVSYRYGDTDWTVDGLWHHLMFVVDRTKTRTDLYLDGVLDNGSGGGTDTLNNIGDISNSASVFIGSTIMDGSIDEPRIYNRALTEAEVLQNYNAGKSKHRND